MQCGFTTAKIQIFCEPRKEIFYASAYHTDHKYILLRFAQLLFHTESTENTEIQLALKRFAYLMSHRLHRLHRFSSPGGEGWVTADNNRPS